MKQIIWVLALAVLALKVEAATCRVVRYKKPNPGLICFKAGHVGTGKRYAVRRFYAASYNACLATCQRDLSCFTVGYTAKKKTCTSYDQRIRSSKFKPDPKSDTIFTNSRCFTLRGACPLVNPSFENSDKSGDGVVKPRPLAQGQHIQPVQILPWAWFSFGPRSWAGFATPKAHPAGSKKAPDGSNFAVLVANGSNDLVLAQQITLKPHTLYTASVEYSFISFGGSLNNPFNDYSLTLGAESGNLPIATASLRPTEGVNGTWYTLSGQFRTKKASFDYFQVQLATPGDNVGKVSRFGIDNFKLREVK